MRIVASPRTSKLVFCPRILRVRCQSLVSACFSVAGFPLFPIRKHEKMETMKEREANIESCTIRESYKPYNKNTYEKNAPAISIAQHGSPTLTDDLIGDQIL